MSPTDCVPNNGWIPQRAESADDSAATHAMIRALVPFAITANEREVTEHDDQCRKRHQGRDKGAWLSEDRCPHDAEA